MMISTRGRYALRVMLDLAEHTADGYIPMNTVSERQGLSLKYIEKIMSVLSKNKLVEGLHGKGGGYRLSKSPSEYTVGEILKLTEGNLAPVSCLCDNAPTCQRADKCKTLSMWKRFHKLSVDFFDNISLEDLI